VLGLAPLLFERSQQAQFLKPTVITLVYGLGFGMFLVLLVVPALVAVQRDLSRPVTSFRRALRRGAGRLRWLMTGAAVVQLGWLVLALGWPMATGALHPALRSLPSLAAMEPVRAGLLAFVLGALVLALLTYLVGGLALRASSRQRA
jgi:hypothetical protein